MITVYVAASYRHFHAVQLLHRALRDEIGANILDWTAQAAPPPNCRAAERRDWFDSDRHGGETFRFCAGAAVNADLLIYYGASGQDSGVEVGMAHAAGVPVLGIKGALEDPGLMLSGAVTAWARDTADALVIAEGFAFAMDRGGGRQQGLTEEQRAAVEKLYARSLEGRS